VYSILLVQRMSLFRAALAAVLSDEDDLQVVADLARVHETVPIARSVQPDVVIVDLDLLIDPTVPARLREAVPSCATLILAGLTLTRSAHEALEPYARGFVSKDSSPGQLAGYVRQVATGDRVLDPILAVSALSCPRNPLNAREQEVLRIAGTGESSAEIAARLHLSVGTVRNYLSTVMHKTGARNRIEAYRIAEEAGWL
jgi:two-component system response regulator DesR